MHWLIKILIGAAVLFAALVFWGVIYLKTALPDVGEPSDLQVEATPERLARGDYLVNHVTVCLDCHSQQNWAFYAGPIEPGSEGKGGAKFGREMGMPGTLYASNLTPAHLGEWTDGEILRAFTAGVNRDGRALFPLMPYLEYGKLSTEDAYSIVVYLRSLRAIPGEVPASALDFPMSLIVNTIPTAAEPTELSGTPGDVAYGQYLARIGGCIFCHTPDEHGTPIAGMELAGGQEYPMPWGLVRTANITPDDATGIGKWTRDQFIGKFKAFAGPLGKIPVEPGGFNTPMPWRSYAHMTEEDLGAIHDYLRTAKAVSNQVEKWVPNSR